MRPPIGRARLVTAPDDEVVIVPIKIVVEPGAHGKAQAKRDERGAKRSLEIHHLRLIYGNIDELRIGREDFDASVVNNNIILRGGLQVPQCLGLGTEPLNGSHYVRLLVEKRLPQGCGPSQVIVHPFENGRVSGKRSNARIPGLLVNQIRVAATVDVPIRQDYFGGQGRRREDLRNQRVRVKRNGAQHLVQFGGGAQLHFRCRRRSWHLRPRGNPRAEEGQQHGRENGFSFHSFLPLIFVAVFQS